MRHARVALFVHCVWATWDRLPLLTGEVERAAFRAIAAKCQQLGANLIALGGVEDHVHLLVQIPATLTVAKLMDQVKGASSHLVTHTVLPADGFFKWQGAYGAFTVSQRHLDAVANYIKHQRQHHAAATTIAAYEPDQIEDVP